MLVVTVVVSAAQFECIIIIAYDRLGGNMSIRLTFDNTQFHILLRMCHSKSNKFNLSILLWFANHNPIAYTDFPDQTFFSGQ